MSSSPINSKRSELPLDSFDPFPISLFRRSHNILIHLVCTLTVSEVVSTNSVEKLNPLVLVLKNIVHYVFGFHSSYCAFISFVPFKSVYHSYHMFLSGSFIFYFLSFSPSTLHLHTATGKFSVVGFFSSLAYAQKRKKVLFYYKYIRGTNIISP